MDDLLLLLKVVLTLLCGWLLLLMVREGRRTFTLYQYQKIPGKITESWLRSDSSDEEAHNYESVIQYEYDVAGTTYTGNTIGSHAKSESKEAFHQGLVAKYPKNQDVEVFYNARKPEESILERQMRVRLLGLIFGLIIAVLLILFTCEVLTGWPKLFLRNV